MKLFSQRFCAAIFALTLAVSIPSVFAADTNWIDATGNWFTATNWDNGAPTSSTNAFINNGGTAQINAAGATALRLELGSMASDSGTVSIGTGGNLNVGAGVTVGFFGTGTFNVSGGGTATTDSLYIAGNVGGTGTVTVDGAGSTLSQGMFASSLVVGDYGTGSLTVSNGATVTYAAMFVGNNAVTSGGSNGTVNIQTGGTVKSLDGGSIGNSAGAVGLVTVDGTGSKWDNGTALLDVGISGRGTLNITNGGNVTNGMGRIGVSSGGTGTVTVDGTGSIWTSSGELVVGDEGTGMLHITNGGAVSCNFAGIGDALEGVGSATVDGAGSTWTNTGELYVGAQGTGTLDITNGGTVSNTNGEIGFGVAATGTVTIDGTGSIWTNSGNLFVGDNGTGTLTITNGGAVSNVTGYIGANTGSSGSVLVSGAGSTWTNSGNVYVGGTDTGPGGAGLLRVDAGGSVSTSSTVFVLGPGTLMGTGTIFGNVNNSGVVSPGDSPGTLTVFGNYIQNSNGTLRIEIGGLTAGVNSDLLHVAGIGGVATLDGTLQLIRINNFRPMIGDRVNIINTDISHTGMFSTVERVNWGLIQPVPMYNEPTDVYVVFELAGTFQSQGETPNQRAVGHAIDQAFSDQCLSSNVLGIVGSIPVADLPRVFDLIAPEEFAAMYEISFSRAVVQSGNLQGRMDQIRDNADPNCGALVEINPPIQEGKNVVSKNVAPSAPAPAPDNRWGTFAMGSGDYVTVHNQDENADGYKIANGSFLAGVDYRLLHNFAIGVYGGYVGSESDLVGHGRIVTDGGTVGGYATFFSHNFYLQAAGGGGWNSYENLRTAFLGGTRSSTDGSELNAMGAIGYDWSMNFNAASHPGSLTVGPIASVQYTNVDINGFRETGSLIPLEFPDQSEDSLRSTIGGKLAICIQTDHGIMLRPEARVAWLHEYNDRAYPIDARFVGCDDLFTVHGPAVGRDAAQVTAGLTVQFNPMIAIYAHYDGLFGRDNYDSNSVSGGLAISF